MKGKVIALFAALILTLIQSVVFLGCERRESNSVGYDEDTEKGIDLVSGQPNQDPSNLNEGELQGMVYDSIGSGSYFMTLENGMNIYYVGKHNTGDTLAFQFRIQNDQGYSGIQTLLINSLNGAALYGPDGQMKVNYYSQMLDENRAMVSAIAENDTLQILQEKIGEVTRGTFTLNGSSQSIEFANADEAYHAKEIYLAYKENNRLSEFSGNDQLLIEKMQQMDEFLSNSNAFENNSNVNVAVNLMSSTEFLYWSLENNPNLVNECNKDCLCNLASLISLIACTFSWTVVGAVVCIIAAGLALACAIARFIEDFFLYKMDPQEELNIV
ncbi:hypothetical protein TRIP_C20923 [Candidatus Zixiibacteriota bacterium]|nr:hypothetical protein TRIP_C20923 [candidate division Zixibacteria bacterium]